VTPVPKGERGHVARWKGDSMTPLPFDTWETFFADCVARVERGDVGE
jgi:hypothetical protein